MPDRETPLGSTGMDFITAIQRCLNKNLEVADTDAGVRFAAFDYM